MADVWGTYTRSAGEGQPDDTVTLQADDINKKRYEAKGFTFVEYVPSPTAGVAVGLQSQENLAINTIQGRQVEPVPEVDQAAIVKEAQEVAFRKMTGTWTDAEQAAAVEAHADGHLLPDGTTPAAPVVDGAAGADGTGTPATAPTTA